MFVGDVMRRMGWDAGVSGNVTVQGLSVSWVGGRARGCAAVAQGGLGSGAYGGVLSLSVGSFHAAGGVEQGSWGGTYGAGSAVAQGMSLMVDGVDAVNNSASIVSDVDGNGARRERFVQSRPAHVLQVRMVCTLKAALSLCGLDHTPP